MFLINGYKPRILLSNHNFYKFKTIYKSIIHILKPQHKPQHLYIFNSKIKLLHLYPQWINRQWRNQKAINFILRQNITFNIKRRFPNFTQKQWKYNLYQNIHGNTFQNKLQNQNQFYIPKFKNVRFHNLFYQNLITIKSKLLLYSNTQYLQQLFLQHRQQQHLILYLFAAFPLPYWSLYQHLINKDRKLFIQESLNRYTRLNHFNNRLILKSNHWHFKSKLPYLFK